MDFLEAMQALTERAQKVKNNLETEEATKNALVMPFIRTLGYDVFNPLEVVPEFTADVAGRKGEKVDYAIMQEEKPIIIIECKCCGAVLDADKCEQLHRYFLTLESSIGILTDGIKYLFYSSCDGGKKMDSKPFMEFDLENIDPTLVPELRKLCKGKFDLKKTLETVNELRFNRQIKKLLRNNLGVPQESFVAYFMKEFGIRAQQKTIEQFTCYIKRALKEFIDEQVDTRLKNALEETSKKTVTATEEIKIEQQNKITTTENEWHGYYLVKSILTGTVDSTRVMLRDALSYCNVSLDGSKFKTLVRFYFNNPKKLSIELVSHDKQKITHQITKIDDILTYAEEIRATAKMYDSTK